MISSNPFGMEPPCHTVAYRPQRRVHVRAPGALPGAIERRVITRRAGHI
jgi:hypothetical protein